jgi:glycosyltransferase involved in cell wall biosynthesis
MAAQTLKPAAWVIVDDGSRDRTPEIAGHYARMHPFIRLVAKPPAGFRQPGPGVIRAFDHGYRSLGNVDYDFIVKLDGDLSFEPDYFERLLGRFLADSRLGIASGIYLEQDNAGAWNEVVMPSYHAAGACKVLRRDCFREIKGFVAAAGWDTVDELRAMTRGWKTGHFPGLRVLHHKPEGSGIGAARTGLMHGEIYYVTGGSKLFLLLKLIHRIGQRPYVLGALAVSWGYLKALLTRKRLLVTREEASFYKALQHDRLWHRAKTLFGQS